MEVNVDAKKTLEDAISEIKNTIPKVMKYSEDIDEVNWTDIANGDFQKIRLSIPKKDNIYVIMIKVETKTEIFDKNNNYYKVKYIGKTYNIRERLRCHLVYKSDTTSSCLKEVKEYILNSSTKELYIRTIEVKPRELNSYVESLLLNNFDDEDVWYTRKS